MLARRNSFCVLHVSVCTYLLHFNTCWAPLMPAHEYSRACNIKGNHGVDHGRTTMIHSSQHCMLHIYRPRSPKCSRPLFTWHELQLLLRCSVLDTSTLVMSYSCRLIEELRKKEYSWREIFWKLWGLAHVLLCSTCLGHFPAADLPLCRHHPGAPVSAQGRSSGIDAFMHCPPC